IVDTRTFATAEAYDKSLSERAQKYAEDLLNEYVENAKEAGVENVELVIKYGSPKVAIAKEIAPEEEADLIIVGATGLNEVERFLIGSVFESIVRYSIYDFILVILNKKLTAFCYDDFINFYSLYILLIIYII